MEKKKGEKGEKWSALFHANWTNYFSPYYFQKVGKLLYIPKLTLRHQISQKKWSH